MTKIQAVRYHYYAAALLLLVVLASLPAVKASLGVYKYGLSACWCAVIAAMILFLPRIHTPGRRCLRERVEGYAFSGAIILLALKFMAAVVMKKLAASPYSLTLLGIVSNLMSILPALLAREMIRAYVLGALWRKSKRPMLWAALVTLIMAVTEMNFTKVVILATAEDWVIYAAKDLAPILAKNILLSVLAVYGGAKSAIIYNASVEIFLRVFPFLPSLPWIAESAIGLGFPILFALFVKEKYQIQNGAQKKHDEGSTVGDSAVLVLAVLFVWFVVGVFPVYPSVVLTGSMEPGIKPGDVVLVKKLATEKEVYQLTEDEVINFKRENITIIHRIIAIEQDEAGNVSFQTKGDNNRSADEQLVKPQDLKGTVIAVVPKVGYPVLFLKSKNDIPEGVEDLLYEH